MNKQQYIKSLLGDITEEIRIFDPDGKLLPPDFIDACKQALNEAYSAGEDHDAPKIYFKREGYKKISKYLEDVAYVMGQNHSKKRRGPDPDFARLNDFLEKIYKKIKAAALRPLEIKNEALTKKSDEMTRHYLKTLEKLIKKSSRKTFQKLIEEERYQFTLQSDPKIFEKGSALNLLLDTFSLSEKHRLSKEDHLLIIDDVIESYQKGVVQGGMSFLDIDQIKPRFLKHFEDYPFAARAHYGIDSIHLKYFRGPVLKDLIEQKKLLRQIRAIPEKFFDDKPKLQIKHYLSEIDDIFSSLHDFSIMESSIEQAILMKSLLKQDEDFQALFKNLPQIEEKFQKEEEEKRAAQRERERKKAEKIAEKTKKEAELREKAELRGIAKQEQETLAFEPYAFDDNDAVFHRIKKRALVDYTRIKNPKGAAEAKDLAVRMSHGLREITALSETINILLRNTKIFGDSVFAGDLLRAYERLFLHNDEKSQIIKMNGDFAVAIATAKENLSSLLNLAQGGAESDILKNAAQERYDEVFSREDAYPHPDQETKDLHIQKISVFLNQEAQRVLKKMEQTPMLVITLTGNKELILRAHKLFDDMHKINLADAHATYQKDLLQYQINKMAEQALENLLGYAVSFTGEEPKEPTPEEQLNELETEELEQEPESLSQQEQDKFEEEIEPETVIETLMPSFSGAGSTTTTNETEVQLPDNEEGRSENKIENDPVFKKLVQQTDDFLLSALVHDVPRDAFKCILELKQDYPITMTLADKNGECSSISLKPETDDLDRALELKIALQSYVLNNNDLIFPYRRMTINKKVISVEIDEPMPISEPDSSVLIRSGGIYRAGMSFTERRKPLDVSFSLGVPSKPENMDLAKERMQLLIEYLADERAKQRWITKREAINFVRSFYKKEEWAITESSYLQGYEEITNLPILSSNTNGPIKLSRALLRYEEGANPSYILNYKVNINDNIQRGAGVRLHTASEELAVQRAHEALDSLQSLFFKKSKEGAILSLDENGGWIAVSEAERKKKIDAKGLNDIFRDSKHFETDIAITCTFAAAQERKDDFEDFILNVTRNSNDNEPETVSDLDGNVVEFKAKAISRKAARDFTVAVNKTFESYINDAYSTRTLTGLRKTPQKYNTKTAPNLFVKAIETHKTEFQDEIVFG